jgi:hypothetical protein
MNRTIARRLEWLEERIRPAGEPKIIEVVFINPDGTEAEGGFKVEIPMYPSAQKRRRRS